MLKWIEIDRSIIGANTRLIKKHIGKKTKLMAVVKADGYGHGANEVSKIALNNGAQMLGVLCVDEALRLREAKIKAPIMTLSPALEKELPLAVKKDIIPTICDISLVKKFFKLGGKNFNLDIDSGLKRWGLSSDLIDSFLTEFLKIKKVFLFSLSTHLAYTPYRNMTDAQEKLLAFSKIAEKFKALFPNLIVHASNSLALCDFPHFNFDMVRVGNLLYGIYPSDIYGKKTSAFRFKDIKRPWKFYSRIISVKNVRAFETFGYAADIVAPKNMRIATIPVGYSDGLSMEPGENCYKITEGSKYWGVIDGKKAPFVSKCAMANTLLDITDIPEAKTGTVVSLHIRRTAANMNIPRIYIRS